MAYGVMIPEKIMATDLGSLNVSVVAGSSLENGMVLRLSGLSVTSGYGECFAGLLPTTGSIAGLYMVYSPEVVVVTSGNNKFKGIDQDPRNFIMSASTVADAYKPQPGDVVLLSEDCFSGARSSNTYANAAVDGWQLVWGTTQTGTALSYQYLGTDYITIGSGSSIGDTRLTAYRMLCLAN